MRKLNKRLVNLKSLDKRRLKAVYVFSLLLILGLFGRIVNLQVINSALLQAKANAMQIQRTNALNERRSIVDRNNRLIAYDKKLFRLWAHPQYFSFPGDNTTQRRSIEEVATKLALVLDINEEIILSKFIDDVTGVELFDYLTEEEAQEIRSLYISGLDLEEYSQRLYPQGNIFSNIVGFVNDENYGSSGLELHLDNIIRVFRDSRILNEGADGTPLPDVSGPDDFVNDDRNIVLTIDSRLQKIAFEALSRQVEEWSAEKGFAIVMNVNNGEILSLVSVPSYDPNRFWEYDQNDFKGWYTLDLFEPGSTFKPINLALALEENIIDKDGLVEDIGKIYVGGWMIANWDELGNGLINYPEVLQFSSNVGMVKIMSALDPSTYWELLNKLGINEAIQTDVFESTPGYLKPKDIFLNQPIEQAVASFGQGFSISPLKLAQLHAALANGGNEVIPHITYEFKNEINNIDKERYFSAEVSQTILEWMESVVNEGTGIGAAIEGYRIGGKTGTSQKAINGIYTDKKTVSFVANLPLDNPKYLVLVVIDEPNKPYAYGSTVAVPVAKEIIESLIVLEEIPPSIEETKIIVKKH